MIGQNGQATLVLVNGTEHPPESAVLSIFDYGVLFGHSVYEVLKGRPGRLFAPGRHLTRLRYSANHTGIALPWSDALLQEELSRINQTFFARFPETSQTYLRLVVTRGIGPLRYSSSIEGSPTRLLFAQALEPLGERVYLEGVDLMLGSFTKGPAQLTEGNVKTGNYLNHVLQLETARQQGYHEAVLCNHLGHVLECTTSNLFWFQGDTLCTPSLNQGVLNGITRQLTLESAAILKIEVMEGQFALETFLQADEAFITSTTRDILPVRRVREKFFSIGPLTKKLSKQFQSMGWEME